MAAYTRPAEPLSIGGVLDSGVRLYRAALKPLFPLALVLSLVAESQSMFMLGTMDPRNPASVNEAMMKTLPFLPVMLLFSSFMYTAMVSRLGAVAAGDAGTLGQALGRGLRRFLPMLVAWFLFTLAFVVGCILLVIPGLYLMVSLSLVLFPLVIEGLGPIASLKKSHQVVKGFWWRTATVLTVAFIMTMVPYMLLGMVLGAITAVAGLSGALTVGGLTGWAVLQWLFTALVYALVLPILLCLQYATYYDLILRKEGGDLERRLEAVPA